MSQQTETKVLNLALLSSVSGAPGYGWHALKPEEVPDWIKDDPELLWNLACGDMVRKGGPWYRAVQFHDPSPTVN